MAQLSGSVACDITQPAAAWRGRHGVSRAGKRTAIVRCKQAPARCKQPELVTMVGRPNAGIEARVVVHSAGGVGHPDAELVGSPRRVPAPPAERQGNACPYGAPTLALSTNRCLSPAPSRFSLFPRRTSQRGAAMATKLGLLASLPRCMKEGVVPGIGHDRRECHRGGCRAAQEVLACSMHVVPASRAGNRGHKLQALVPQCCA